MKNALALFAGLASLAYSSIVRADPPVNREWAALGVGAAVPLSPGGGTGVALSEEMGRHWLSDRGDRGFATGLLFGESFHPSGAAGQPATETLSIQFRALYDIGIPVGDALLVVGPGLGAGADILFAGGTTAAFVLTPHVDVRYLFGEEGRFFAFARVAVPLDFRSGQTESQLWVLGGAGIRFKLL